MQSAELTLYPETAAIYFLLDGVQVVYVGQTQDLRNSFQIQRHLEKTYQRVRYVPVGKADLDAVEMACIVYFKPKYNRMRHTKKISAEQAETKVRRLLSDDDLDQLGVTRRAPCKYEYDYPRPSVTVDCVVFGFDLADKRDPLKVLLIQRNSEPYAKCWAIPGGFVETNDIGGGESLERAAQRELEEETGLRLEFEQLPPSSQTHVPHVLKDGTTLPPNWYPDDEPRHVPAYLEQLYTFGAPRRDPRGRVISVAYLVLVRAADYVPQGGSDASQAKWVGIQDALTRNLAFDHAEVLSKAITRLQGKIRYEPIGFNLLPDEFALSDLRDLYAGVLQRELDLSNFRKRVLATGVLSETGHLTEGSGRPAALYRFNKTAYDQAVKTGFNFEI